MMLRLLLHAYRKHYGLSLRDLEGHVGISYVTLHRFEKGRPIMQDDLIRLWQWLMKPDKPVPAKKS